MSTPLRKKEKRNMWRSLRTQLTIIFIGLAIGPLFLVGVILAQRSFAVEQEQALDLQGQVAQRVSTETEAFLQDVENDLRLLGGEIRGLEQPDRAQQLSLLLGVFNTGPFRNVYQEFALLDDQGQEQLRVSRQEIIAPDELGNRSGMDEFERPKASGKMYFSPVWFDETTGEPLMTIAIPLSAPRSVQLSGVLVADIRFKTVEDLIASLQVSEGQTVYAVDPAGRVVAHQDPSIELVDMRFELPEQAGTQTGLDGTDVVLAVDDIQLGEQTLTIVAERPVSEALESAINTVYTIAVTIMVALAIAGGLGFLVVRQIIRPVEIMATTAQVISAGDLSQRVEVTRRDELGTLATAFNAMTGELSEIINTLEYQVAERTRDLETVVDISQQLAGILEVSDLMRQVVVLTKERFDYYHVHIYLTDETNKKLMMTEGYGQAGAEMKRRGHTIELSAEKSLVARAARQHRIVLVQDVREDPEWLPNELLPETQAEMAVPIISGTKVLGVLDVQSNQVDGLTDEDGAVLLALANQVAVAVRNAELFAETQQALNEAEKLQRLYTGQAWERFGATRSTTDYEIRQAALPSIGQITTPEAVTAAQHKQTIDLRIGSDGWPGADEGTEAAIATPLKIGDEIIGVLGVRDTNPDRRWTEEETALIEAVSEQMSLALENARLFEETGRRAGRERIIADVTRQIWASGELDYVMRTAVEQLGKTLDASKVVLRLGTEDRFRIVSSANGDDTTPEPTAVADAGGETTEIGEASGDKGDTATEASEAVNMPPGVDED